MSEVHYMEMMARQVDAEIGLARGGTERAVGESERALDFARNARGPAGALPDARGAHAAARARRTRDGSGPAGADELMALVGRTSYTGTGGRSASRSRWTTSADFRTALVCCEPDASRLVARGGACLHRRRPRSCSRHLAATWAAARTRRTRGFAQPKRETSTDQLNQALAFYRGVGARLFVRRGEALLSASA